MYDEQEIKSAEELKAKVELAYEELPQRYISQAIDQFKKRLQTVIDVKDDAIEVFQLNKIDYEENCLVDFFRPCLKQNVTTSPNMDKMI